jgi:hypothetical protein
MAYKNLDTSIDNMKVNKPIKIALIGGSGDVGGYVSFVDELFIGWVSKVPCSLLYTRKLDPH